MKIAVDAMGGDFAPRVVVEGAILAAREKGVPVILVGDRDRVEHELERCDAKDLPLSVYHASEVVGMEESPSYVMRRKKDSSLRVCFDLVKKGEASALVSAGNSGAAMAIGMVILKRLKGVDRPAIVVTMPTLKGMAVMLDVGANVDCKSSHLVQFAIMGSVYARYVLNKEGQPRVGLLSNGEEEAKGNELTKETHYFLKKSSMNYIGYVEGGDIYSGDVDIVVCDGFVGNVALKISEGLVDALGTMLKQGLTSSLSGKIGYLFTRRAFKDIKKRVDYSEYGGASLLGIDGICIISHGSSTAKAIKNAIYLASKYAKQKVNTHLLEELNKHKDIQRLSKRGTLRVVE
ncbi:MAG: phosphate acyltransferase PlsX [Thermodesulfobacteriota bacterium]